MAVEQKKEAFFKHGKLTEFEKLLFLESYVKELKKTISERDMMIGTLKSDISELEYLFKKEKPENSKLRSYKLQIKEMRVKCKALENKYQKLLHEFILLKNANNERKIICDFSDHLNKTGHNIFDGDIDKFFGEFQFEE